MTKQREMKVTYLIFLLLVSNIKTFAQQEENDTTIYMLVDRYPVLIANGKEYEYKELKYFIREHLVYPDNGNDCSGTVYISFVIEKNGEISSKRFERKLCPGFDENAMHVIDLMKNWNPGMKDGKRVRTKLTVPVRWIL